MTRRKVRLEFDMVTVEMTDAEVDALVAEIAPGIISHVNSAILRVNGVKRRITDMRCEASTFERVEPPVLH